MPRVKKIDRPVAMRVYLPQSVFDKLQLELYSELEGKGPHGKQSEVLTELTINWLKTRGVIL